jgi:hypothetical protein
MIAEGGNRDDGERQEKKEAKFVVSAESSGT